MTVRNVEARKLMVNARSVTIGQKEKPSMSEVRVELEPSQEDCEVTFTLGFFLLSFFCFGFLSGILLVCGIIMGIEFMNREER